MPEPPASWKINTISPAFLLEGAGAQHPQKVQNCLFNFILFLRVNGKWPHLCQLPWNWYPCTAQAGAWGSVSHHIPPLSDVDGTAIEAKCHNFGSVQEKETYSWEPTWLSQSCDCPVSSEAHQKAPKEKGCWKSHNFLSQKHSLDLILKRNGSSND